MIVFAREIADPHGHDRPLLVSFQGAGAASVVTQPLPGGFVVVHDAELIRRELGIEQWSVLGQSFGGFCVTAYLSRAWRACARRSLRADLPAGFHTTTSTGAHS